MEPFEIPAAERYARDTLEELQGRRLGQLLADIYGRNAFYTRKLDAVGIELEALAFPDDLTKLPFTTKAELAADQEGSPPWGTALTEPIERYTRYHQTSSTTGRPLRWLDTNESWRWVLDCWKAVYRAAHVGAGDRVLFPFSFGPFIGFWAGFEAGVQIDAHCVPGGTSSQFRLALIDEVRPTVVCCTPTYALRLLDVAAESPEGRPPLSRSSVRVLIVAGEPGGSIPATRKRIESGWGARVIDHHGLTEVGPVSFECWESPGFLHLNECEYICEVLAQDSPEPAPEGEPGELVITNLGRTASPVIRYRTGDVVLRSPDRCRCGRTLARADGGILARADRMVNVRGVNVYPGAIDAVVHHFSEIVEYRATVATGESMRSLTVEIELAPQIEGAAAIADRLAEHLREALSLTVPVRPVEPGALPRFETKARRFVVKREA